MNIEQAEKRLSSFNSNLINGGVNVHDVVEFCMDFSDLMKKQKMSSGNESLFANLSALFIWSGDYLKTAEMFFEIIEKYIDRMKSGKSSFEFL